MRNTNQYTIDKNVTKIIINSKKYGLKHVLVDTDNIERIKQYTWFLKPTTQENKFYVQTKINKKNVYLHRFLTDCPNGLMVDHQNGNAFDNKICNLKICTSKENQENRLNSQKNNKSSGIRGITWHKKTNKWQVKICHNYKHFHIGLYSKIQDAEQAAINARREYFTNYIAC